MEQLDIRTSVWAIETENGFAFQKYPGIFGPRNVDEPERIKIDFNQFLLEYDIKSRGKLNTYKYLFNLNELDLLKKMYNNCLIKSESKFITITGINTNKNISVIIKLN